uniref:Uncharacterized protein n=1 Tax=Amphimedon queenslandica TaxID=400682 RepID=A0A1X7TQJ3_AMPQE
MNFNFRITILFQN